MDSSEKDVLQTTDGASSTRKWRNDKSKSLTIRFRIEHDQLKKYQDQCEELKINMSEYLRTRIKKGHVKVYTVDKTYEKIHFELNKIGVNLNQIAKVLNETRDGNQPKVIIDIENQIANLTKLVATLEQTLDAKTE